MLEASSWSGSSCERATHVLFRAGDAWAVEQQHAAIVRLVTLAGVELLKQRPGMLLGKAQLQAYLAGLAPAPAESDDEAEDVTWSPAPAVLGGALRAALDLHISIADRPTVASTLQRHAELAARASMEVGDVADTQEPVEQKESKSGSVQRNCVTHEVLQGSVHLP